MPIAVITRDVCVNDPLLVAILVAANLAVVIAYVRIPLALAWVATRAPRVPFPAAWWLSVCFILSCAGSHACAALVFFRAAWHLEAAVLIATAVISNVTAHLFHRWRKPILAAIHDYVVLADSIAKADP